MMDALRTKGAADFLSLAAAPTFACMAVLTGVLGGSAPDMICSAAAVSPLGGMIPMYALMSAFHLAPWLKLIAKAARTAEDTVSRAARDVAPTNS